MALDPKIIQNVKAAQERVFRLAKRDHGLTLKAISLDSGIDYDSLCNYAKGETQMGVASLNALIGVIPDCLLSLLLFGDRVIVRAPDEINHDEIADAMVAYLGEKQAAHRPESECGPAIGPNESNVLRLKLAPVSVAGAAA
jgi:hypothetical protein